jgi:hypothetical protein
VLLLPLVVVAVVHITTRSRLAEKAAVLVAAVVAMELITLAVLVLQTKAMTAALAITIMAAAAAAVRVK